MRYFETIKCEDYNIFNLYYHKQRILNTIGRDFPLEEYIYPPDNKLYKCKVIYDKNSILDVSFKSYTPKNFKSFKLVQSDLLYDKKYLNRDELNNLFNKKDDCDDIIIYDKNSFLKDTSIANIALLIDDVWFTPKQPLLLGTQRAKLLEKNVIIEKALKIDALKEAKSFAIFNAMIGFKVIDDFVIKV